jgi:hypothetical protein
MQIWPNVCAAALIHGLCYNFLGAVVSVAFAMLRTEDDGRVTAMQYFADHVYWCVNMLPRWHFMLSFAARRAGGVTKDGISYRAGPGQAREISRREDLKWVN